MPAKAEAQVLKALGAVAPMVTVHSEAAIRDEAARKAGLTKVEGDGRLHLLLMPFHQGLKAPAAGGAAGRLRLRAPR